MWSIIEKIVVFFLGLFFRVFHKELKEETKKGFLQFIKFGLVGVTNTVIGYLLYVGTLFVLKPYDVRWDFVAANTVMFVLSVFWSFMLNSHFVFKKEQGESRNFLKALMKTYLSYGFTGIVLNNILLLVWINVLSISKFIAPLLNLIVSVPVNFFMNKLWAFKTEKTSDDDTNGEKMLLKEKCPVLHFEQLGDERGHLVIVEGKESIPFSINRVFYIYGSDRDVVRGQHANKESEFVLINVAGTSKVRLTDGTEELIVELNEPHMGVYIPKMIWKDMYDFSEDSVLLVLASTHYDPEEYIRDYENYIRTV